MAKIQKVIKRGEDTAQIATGKTIRLSSVAEKDLLITLEPTTEEQHCKLSQLRLAWMWATDQANSGIGQYDDKDNCYLFFKVRFLAPVLCEADTDFAALWDQVGTLKDTANPEVYRALLGKAVSHDDATSAQMAEALTTYEQWCIKKGIELRNPSDYKFAMQIESYSDMPELSSEYSEVKQ